MKRILIIFYLLFHGIILKISAQQTPSFTISYRTFIPNAFVKKPTDMSDIANKLTPILNPFPTINYFKGDNSFSFKHDRSSYRTRMDVKLDFNAQATNEILTNIATSSKGCEEVYNGDCDDNKDIKNSQEGIAGTICSKFYTDKNDLSLDGNKKNRYTFALANFQLDAANKAVMFAPSINGKFQIFIKPNIDPFDGSYNGEFNCYVIGSIDQFPAHEIWVTENNTGKNYLIFAYTPTLTSETPWGLIGNANDLKYYYTIGNDIEGADNSMSVWLDETQNVIKKHNIKMPQPNNPGYLAFKQFDDEYGFEKWMGLFQKPQIDLNISENCND